MVLQGVCGRTQYGCGGVCVLVRVFVSSSVRLRSLSLAESFPQLLVGSREAAHEGPTVAERTREHRRTEGGAETTQLRQIVRERHGDRDVLKDRKRETISKECVSDRNRMQETNDCTMRAAVHSLARVVRAPYLILRLGNEFAHSFDSCE